jgi:hypothetical protein
MTNDLKSYCQEHLDVSDRRGFYKETAKLFEVSYEAVRSTCRRLRKTGFVPATPEHGGPKHPSSKTQSPSISIENGQGSAFIQAKSPRITSLHDLIRNCNIDLNEWEIEKYVTNKWEVGAVIDGEIIVEPLYQIKAWLKKKKIDESGKIEKSVESAIKMMDEHSPGYSKIEYTTKKNPHLLIVDAADIHIGKYASLKETGSPYDIGIAKNRALDGMKGIIEKSSGFQIERMCLMIGNDILHVDNPKNTTTSGTFQNTSGMWHEMFDEALDLYVQMIEMAMNIAPVHVVYNPSNHDYASGYMLAQALKSWFRTSDDVTFDVSIKHRKYFSYGKNLICTSHGDGAKSSDMPLIMANEQPELWSDCPYRYVYLHHIHHKVQTKFMTGKDYHGVTIEYVRSPSTADSWHDRNGYMGVPKAVEGFVHSVTKGQVARITHIF